MYRKSYKTLYENLQQAHDSLIDEKKELIKQKDDYIHQLIDTHQQQTDKLRKQVEELERLKEKLIDDCFRYQEQAEKKTKTKSMQLYESQLNEKNQLIDTLEKQLKELKSELNQKNQLIDTLKKSELERDKPGVKRKSDIQDDEIIKLRIDGMSKRHKHSNWRKYGNDK